MTDPRRPKQWGDTMRAGVGLEHRRTPTAVPLELPDEVTGQYEGEELARLRRRRPTEERIARLEDKADRLSGAVAHLGGEVANMSGKLDILPRLIDTLERNMERASQRETVTLTAQVEVDKAEKLDVLDGRKARRALLAKIVGAVASVEVLRELIHRLGWL